MLFNKPLGILKYVCYVSFLNNNKLSTYIKIYVDYINTQILNFSCIFCFILVFKCHLFYIFFTCIDRNIYTCTILPIDLNCKFHHLLLLFLFYQLFHMKQFDYLVHFVLAVNSFNKFKANTQIIR